MANYKELDYKYGRRYALNPLALGLNDEARFETQKQSHFEVHLRVPDGVQSWYEKNQKKGYKDQNGLSVDLINASKIITLACTTFSLPTFSVETSKFNHGNTSIKYASTPNISGADSLSCVDFIGADLEGIFYCWFNYIYNPETTQMGWAKNYKTDGTVIEYAPDGSCASKWCLRGVFPTEINFGSLDTSSADMKKVEIKLSYDVAYRKFSDNDSRTYAGAEFAAGAAKDIMEWKSPNEYVTYKSMEDNNGGIGQPWSYDDKL